MLIQHITKYLVQQKQWLKYALAVTTCFCITAEAMAQTAPQNPPPSTEKTAASTPVQNSSQNNIDSLSTPEYVLIRPVNQATFSSEIAATVDKIYEKEGSHFKEGEILLEMDCRIQQADLLKAKAEQDAANIALKSAIKLEHYGSISEFELVKAQSDAQIAKSEVVKLSTIVDKCSIKAPYDGAVAELRVHEHESVKPGDPLMKIVSIQNLEFEMQVPSNWLQQLHIGSTLSVHINDINKTISARITKINPEIDSVSQTVKITGTIDNQGSELLPGMTGQVILPKNIPLTERKIPFRVSYG